MPHEALFKALLQQQRICILADIQTRLAQEKQGLNNLRSRHFGYLNQYDQLFRLINIWLLIYGFDLTNHEPHQVLKAVCQNHMPHIDVPCVIRERHALKKGQKDHVSAFAQVELEQLHSHFMLILQAYVKPEANQFSA